MRSLPQNNRLFLASISILVLGLHEINFVFSLPLVQNPEETGPYFQGDILLDSAHYSGRRDLNLRWPNRTVPYLFESSYPFELRTTFMQAIAHISDRTCLKFVPVTESPHFQDYIFVVGSVSRSCSSYVGRRGGSQQISLPQQCHRLGTFVHEILHVVGFHHEHSRTDRDDHVTILWENVQPGSEHQFRVYNESTVTSFGVNYDFGSVMHYSETAFSRDSSRLKTIVPNVPVNVVLGQRNGMSAKDAEKVNKMYRC